MKMTLKIVSLCAILLLLGAMTLTLYAEEPQSSTVSATVIATNTPTYSVIVPTGITADDLQRTSESDFVDKEFTISIPEVLSLDGRQICVRVYGDNGVFVLQGSDGTSTLPYQVYSNANTEQALASGDVFAIFTQEGEQSGFVRIDQKDILKTDTYTGNLRFSFFVGDVEE
ncbi:MAG: hypothetical protein IJB94_01380 [Clostridia bacterium]|nr:hypothetical protein [Clostridia bacterium]